METRYCIEYINPQYPLREDGNLNIRYDRVLTLEEAEHVLVLILSFGGKIVDLYMGNVVDGKIGEWNPKPIIVDDNDWFSTEWLKTLKCWIPIDEDFERDAVNFCFDNGLNTTPYIAKTIAKHFFELGLKAQKGE